MDRTAPVAAPVAVRTFEAPAVGYQTGMVCMVWMVCIMSGHEGMRSPWVLAASGIGA